MDTRSADVYRIRGGRRLAGRIVASGSKNASLPILAASILASEPVDLVRVPRLTDVRSMVELLRSLGLRVGRTAPYALRIEPANRTRTIAPRYFVRQMRASFCVLGPLLARYGRAIVPLPGGCRIGPRPIDLHLRGLAALGADIKVEGGRVFAQAKRLQGGIVDLRGPHGTTVTGTANVLTAATLAEGVTVIRGAAVEPEIGDLSRFLTALGASIEGIGTSTLVIQGVEQLGGAQHVIIADRIEAATLLMAAAVTGGEVTVADVVPAHLASVLQVLASAGVEVSCGTHEVRVATKSPLRPIRAMARPFPGLPTDVQAQLSVVAALAEGASRIQDRVFPERFAHLTALHRFGVRGEAAAGVAHIDGGRPLVGARVTATDLRASAALVLAGLAAEGTTYVRRIDHLDRGYDNLAAKLRGLGADVVRLRRAMVDRCRGPLARRVPRA